MPILKIHDPQCGDWKPGCTRDCNPIEFPRNPNCFKSIGKDECGCDEAPIPLPCKELPKGPCSEGNSWMRKSSPNKVVPTVYGKVRLVSLFIICQLRTPVLTSQVQFPLELVRLKIYCNCMQFFSAIGPKIQPT